MKHQIQNKLRTNRGITLIAIVITTIFSYDENVNEELKAQNQIKWVQMMNNIKNRAEEIVINEIIYQ